MADWNPELYNRFRRYREEPFLAILERLRLRGEESIIDLGCGSGENTVELARRVPRGCAVGIDSSSAMIEAANKVLEGVEGEVRERLSFQLANIATFNSAGNIRENIRRRSRMPLCSGFPAIVRFSSTSWMR